MMAGRLGHLGFCRRPKTRSLENGGWRLLGLEGRDGGAPEPSKQPLCLNIAGHRLVSGVGLPFLYRSFWTKEAGSVPVLVPNMLHIKVRSSSTSIRLVQK